MGDYFVELYTRGGRALGRVPCTWTATLANKRVASLNIEGRAEELLVAAACRPLERMLVLREETGDDPNPVRVAAEVVGYERTRDKDGKGSVKITALSPEWRWWSMLAGNLATGSTWGSGDGLGDAWFAPPGSNRQLAAGTAAPTLDRSEAARRLVLAAGYAGETLGSTSGSTHSQALGLKTPAAAYEGRWLIHDAGIREGSVSPAGGVITTLPEDLARKSVGQLIDELAAGLDGFEWWIDYVSNVVEAPASDEVVRGSTRGHRLAANWGNFSTSASRGAYLPSVVYEYGAGAANVETFTDKLDGSIVATAATVPAPGGLTAEANNAAQPGYSVHLANALRYGLLDKLVSIDLSSLDMRQQIADDVITIGSQPRQTVSLTPAPRGAAGGAWPFTDFDVGDRINLRVWERPEVIELDGRVSSGPLAVTLDGIVRVYGFTLQGGPNLDTTATVSLADEE